MPAISTGYPAGGPRHDMHDRFYMVAERRVVSVTAVGSKVVPGVKTIFQPV